MLRLFLDANDGAGIIPCPVCDRPLLLGVKKMGKFLVGYRGGFCLRPGSRALLVCPDYSCDHEEEVEIARTPADAVVFSALHAAGMYRMAAYRHTDTLAEVAQEIQRLITLHKQGAGDKLLCAIRYWREQYQFKYWQIKKCLEESHEKGREISCQGKNWHSVQGTVRGVLPDGVLLERTANGETVFLRTADLSYAGFCLRFSPRRFDFGGDDHAFFGSVRDTPWHFVVIAGHPLALTTFTPFGICRAQTRDVEVARTLNLRQTMANIYVGEFPTALVERYYLQLRYYRVQGFRLHLLSETGHPGVLQLGTHQMETARALRMHRQWTCVGQRQALRWWRYFEGSEIGEMEEVQVPLRLPRARRL